MQIEIEECWDDGTQTQTVRLGGPAPEGAEVFWSVYIRYLHGTVDHLHDEPTYDQAREWVEWLTKATEKVVRLAAEGEEVPV